MTPRFILSSNDRQRKPDGGEARRKKRYDGEIEEPFRREEEEENEKQRIEIKLIIMLTISLQHKFMTANKFYPCR